MYRSCLSLYRQEIMPPVQIRRKGWHLCQKGDKKKKNKSYKMIFWNDKKIDLQRGVFLSFILTCAWTALYFFSVLWINFKISRNSIQLCLWSIVKSHYNHFWSCSTKIRQISYTSRMKKWKWFEMFSLYLKTLEFCCFDGKDEGKVELYGQRRDEMTSPEKDDFWEH